ncbi:MAG: division/cell wall cluster transcriptional repressor MraZ [Propionibacterium sp.]|nr:division/cell wall cluster transcriptional repressor MraZ [Propionibacterium sp.]
MFLGTHHPKLDDKGRFFLPAKFRDALDGGFVMTKNFDHCLAIYTREDFLSMVTSVSKAQDSVKRVRQYQRQFGGSATEGVADKQGRVTIPQQLREYAALDRDIVVVGAVSRIEVWDAATWAAYDAEQEENFADMDAEIFPAT